MVITHFTSAGGVNTDYFYTIYRMLVKLRGMFKIGFKVELVEEKIRNSFNFWLQLIEDSIKWVFFFTKEEASFLTERSFS